MSLRRIYDSSFEEQSYKIRRLANNSIRVIWVAGIGCMLIFIIYFLILPAKTERNKAVGMLTANTDPDLLFSDKTTLVNIGLRMQEDITENKEKEKEKPQGTIRINKIIYDKKISKAKKSTAPDFFIKAVPK